VYKETSAIEILFGLQSCILSDIRLSIVVQKYGGSSVSDVNAIRAVAERVVNTVQAGNQVVVVVSAMGDTTNELIGLAKAVSKEPTRRELDLLMSVGERVSMTLLAMAIQDLGVAAQSFTGSQSGIITDEVHANAQIIEVRPHRIQHALNTGHVAIVAGFQGVSRTREVTTLGRGGSDATAVALAAALSADICEICSDVPGVFSTDPRVVPEAVMLSTLSLNDAYQLSRNGARILHADALDFARRNNIVLVANATTSPMGEGTRLLPDHPNHFGCAVTLDKNLFWINGLIAAQYRDHIRAAVGEKENQFFLLDPSNIHGGDFSSPDIIPVATLTVVGVAPGDSLSRALQQTLLPFGLHYFWSMERYWTGVLDQKNSTEALRTVHTLLLRM